MPPCLILSIIIFTNPSAWAGYGTRSIFKRSLTGLNSEFSFSYTSCLTKAEEPSLPYYLPIAGGRMIGFIPFPRVLVLCEMQSVTSRIWTRVAVSIFYDDNHHTTGTLSIIRHVSRVKWSNPGKGVAPSPKRRFCSYWKGSPSTTVANFITYIKAKIDKTQQNSKYRLCADRNKTIDHIISECSKLAHKERIRLDRTAWRRWSTGNCAKSLNLTLRTNGICTPQNPYLRLRRINHSGIFEIQTVQLISTRRPGLVIVNKKKRKKENLPTLLSWLTTV